MEINIGIERSGKKNHGDIRNMHISERKKENGAMYFITLLEDILKTEQIFRIGNLKEEHEQVYLELGISYDYFLLNCLEQTYILYFTYRG